MGNCLSCKSKGSHSLPENSDTLILPYPYKIGNRLGGGKYSTIYECMNMETGNLYAVKESSISRAIPESELPFIREEVSNRVNLRHQNIVQVHEVNQQNYTLRMILEYMPGGSIKDVLKQFGPCSEPLTKNYSKQLVHAVGFIHRNSIVHRDIKSSNLLLDGETLKLADFGDSKWIATRHTQNATLKRNTSVPTEAPAILVDSFPMDI